MHPNSMEYWHFDLVDMANDHVAAVEFILQQTGFGQLHMYGYGTGGQALAYAISVFPDFFNPRVRDVQYVASTLTMFYTRNIVLQLGASLPGFLTALENIGITTLADTNPFVQLLSGLFCHPSPQV